MPVRAELMLFQPAEQQYLQQLSQRLPLSVLLSCPRNQEEIGIDFVHHSAQLSGNRYDIPDTLTLLKMGQTAGGKCFSDAQMLLNLRSSYQHLLSCLNDDKLDLQDLIQNNHALIVKHPFPALKQANTGLANLISTSNTINNHFDKALYLHNNLACFPFFGTGNQRTARNIMAFTLMKAGVFPCIFWADSNPFYTDALIAYKESGDHRRSKDYFIHIYERTIKRYEPQPDPEFTRNI